jgi:transcriptional regulator with XRE-family HTH domain
MPKPKDNLLKKLLRLRNVSQKELAKAIGMTPQRIGDRITDLNFSTDEFPKMAKLLKLSETDLFGVIRGDEAVFKRVIQT